MADGDMAAKLQEASKQFASASYASCKRILDACPQEDPKIVHNAALVEFVRKGGNYRIDQAAPYLSVHVASSLDGGPAHQHITFDYDGHDLACVNTAIMRLANVDIDGARSLLVLLAQNAPALSLKAQVRVAVLLNATRKGAKPSALTTGPDVDRLIANLTSDKAGIQADPSLAKLVQVALATDASSASRALLLTSPKQPADKVLFLNNIGVEAFADGKAHVASAYFAKACVPLLDASGAPVASFCPFLIATVFFNSGLCALSRCDGGAAVQAFSVAQVAMSGSAVFWARVAQAHSLRIAESFRAASAERLVELEKQHSQALVASARRQPFEWLAQAQRAILQRHPAESLPAHIASARAAISNAWLLFMRKGESLTAAVMRLAGAASQAQLFVSSIVHAAYVELAAGNYPLVVRYTTEYFQFQKSCTACTKQATAAMLAYSVEALCAVSRPAQALRVLGSLELGDILADGCAGGATEALFITLTVAHIHAKAWPKAAQLAHHVIAKFGTRYSHLLLIYVELAQGNREKALDILERNSFILAPEL